jgi:anti-sigma B factor antagonist
MEEVKPIVSIDHTENAVVVTLLYEEIVSDADINKLEESITALIIQGRLKNLVLDFSRVRYLSSSALGYLVTLNKSLRQQGGCLKVCGIDKKVKNASNDRYIYELLKIVQLDKFFDIYDSVDDALQCLSK